MKNIIGLLILLSSCTQYETKIITVSPEVNIKNLYTTGKISIFSGKNSFFAAVWAIDTDNLITANHVCSDINKLNNNFKIEYIVLGKIFEEIGGKVVYRDEINDICIINFKNHGITPLKISFTTPIIGSKIQVIGSQWGYWPYTDFGYTINPNFLISGGDRRILTSNLCPGGSSGGPMIDESGDAVGMVLEGSDTKFICAGISSYIIQMDIDRAKSFLNLN